MSEALMACAARALADPPIEAHPLFAALEQGRLTRDRLQRIALQVRPGRIVRRVSPRSTQGMVHLLLLRAFGGRRGRAGLAAAGVGACTLLVLVLLAAHRSLTAGIVAYTGQPGADLWICPVGTDNMVRSGGFVPADLASRLRDVRGVADIRPLLRTFARVETADRARRLTLLAIGHDGTAGGPPELFAGRRVRAAGEVVLDRAAAFRLGVGLDDRVDVNEEPLRVVGLSRGTNLIATQFLFAAYPRVEDALGAYGRASFLVVRVVTGHDPRVVARRLEARAPAVAVLTRPEFVAHNLREVAAGSAPLLVLCAALGLGAASLTVGLLALGLVEERRTEIAVLFALGAAPSQVARGVVAHLGRLVLAGAALGAAAAHGLRTVPDHAVPTIELTCRVADLGLVVALFVGAGLLTAAGPVARLQRVDPLEAFSS